MFATISRSAPGFEPSARPVLDLGCGGGLYPGRDVGDVTAILGAKLVRELAALIDRNGTYTP